MSDLFARVRPLIGDVLQARTVAVMGALAAHVLVEYLGMCGVQRWVTLDDNAWLGAALAQLGARFGPAYAPTVRVSESPGEIAADLAVVVDDWALACALPMTLPRLAILTPGSTGDCRAQLALAGESFTADPGYVRVAHQTKAEVWDWQCAAPLVALWARALLLQGTAYVMPTWDAALARGVRVYTVGGGDDPTRAQWQDGMRVEHTLPPFRTPLLRRGTLMIVGLGSLGSVAAQALAPWVERLILVDPDAVEVANLVRQSYSHDQIGMAKAVALAETLRVQTGAPEIVPLVMALTDDKHAAQVMRDFAVDALLVTTGTHADFALARAAHAAAIPHVVGRCYARARYWEGIVVDGAGTPSYGDVRRGVALGPTPAPTPEEIAAYGPVNELVAEPATALETGWAAWWLARLMAQMLQPPTLREGWLLARLAAGANCFVGGLVVEAGEEGAAYGVRVPGEVHAWSAAEIGDANSLVAEGAVGRV